MTPKPTYYEWQCPRCDWLYVSVQPISAAGHQCPKGGTGGTVKFVSLKPKKETKA